MGLNRKIRLQTSYIELFCYEMECFGPKAKVLRKVFVVTTPGATHSESQKKISKILKFSFFQKFHLWVNLEVGNFKNEKKFFFSKRVSLALYPP